MNLQLLRVSPFISVSQLCADLQDPDVHVTVAVVEGTEIQWCLEHKSSAAFQYSDVCIAASAWLSALDEGLTVEPVTDCRIVSRLLVEKPE